MAIQYYVADLESNGLMWKNNNHEICELSVIRVSDRTQLTRYVRVDKPQNSSFDALRIIGRTSEDLKKGISKIQLVNDVEQFLKEDMLEPNSRCLIGHNIINFDRKFLWQHWETCNKIFPFDLYLDTMHLMRAYAKLKQLIKPAINLTASCKLLGIKQAGQSHTGHFDTQHTFLLWRELIRVVDHLPHIKRIPHGTDDAEY
jgi:DNA polymerase III alpha subunit (gram-positive type)